MVFTPKFVDLVRNVAVVQGIGPVTLGAAVNGYTSLADAVGEGEQFYYCIQGIEKPEEREVGRGTMQPDGLVAREPIGGVATEFTNGAKTIALVAPAEWFAKLEALSGELDAALPGALKTRSALEVERSLAVGENTSVVGDLTVDGFTFAKGNLTVGGDLNVPSNSTSLGPTFGEASDCNVFVDNTNYNSFLNFRSWNGGMPQLDGWVRGRRGIGLELNGINGVALQHNSATIANVSSTGLELAAGKALTVNGKQLIGEQLAPISDDNTGAANQTTVNAILATLRNHGLIAP